MDTFGVTFRPLRPLDVPTASSAMAVAASIENVAWLALVGAVVWVMLNRRFSLTRLLTMSLTCCVLAIAGMAALEGNFGTAFRHKSSTLWVLCAVLHISGGRVGRWPRSRVPSAGGEVPREGDPDAWEARERVESGYLMTTHCPVGSSITGRTPSKNSSMALRAPGQVVNP